MKSEGPAVGQIELTEKEQIDFKNILKIKDKQLLLDFLFYLQEQNKKIDFEKANKLLLKKSGFSFSSIKKSLKKHLTDSKYLCFDADYAIAYAGISGSNVNLIYDFIVNKLKDPFSAITLVKKYKNEISNTTNLESLICNFQNIQLVLDYVECFSMSKFEGEAPKIREEILEKFKTIMEHSFEVSEIEKFEYYVPKYKGAFEEEKEWIEVANLFFTEPSEKSQTPSIRNNSVIDNSAKEPLEREE